MKRDPLFLLGAHVAAQEDLLVEQAESDEATRQLLAEHSAKRRPRPSSTWRWMVPAAATALMGVVAGLLISAGVPSTRRTPSFTVGEGLRPGVLQAWESAPSNDKLPIRFSDGTEVSLGPNTRAQVTRLGIRGAEVVVESGHALVDVVPTKDGDWRVRTGPFLMVVKGTRFEVAWNPKSDLFELNLIEGRVVVTGCSFGGGRVLETGQRVRASCRGAEPVASPPGARLGGPSHGQSTSNVAPTVSAIEKIAPKATAAPLAAPPPTPPVLRSRESWRELAHEGHFKRAYELAAEAGFETECERASAEDAVILGDSARLGGRRDRARLAYASVRDRFRGTDAAARAAFALGRLAADTGDLGTAAGWFETYLDERPSGPLAQAAIDRLLEAALRLGDSRRVRSIAGTYVARYPSGPRADEARQILKRVEPKDER